MNIKKTILCILAPILIGCVNNPNTSSTSNQNASFSSGQDIISCLPEIETLDKTYFNYNSYDNYKLELDIPSIAILHIDGIELDKKHYIYNNNLLIISNNFLVELGYGKYILSINKKEHYSIIIYDDREPLLKGDKMAIYNSNVGAKFEFVLLDGITRSLIYNEHDYSQYMHVKNGTLIINSDFCERVLLNGLNNIIVSIEKDYPNGIKYYNFDLQIYIPETGEYIPGDIIQN